MNLETKNLKVKLSLCQSVKNLQSHASHRLIGSCTYWSLSILTCKK